MIGAGGGASQRRVELLVDQMTATVLQAAAAHFDLIAAIAELAIALERRRVTR